jgi:hypothetical protein
MIGGIFAFYHFGQYPTVYRAVALLPVVATSLFFVFLTSQGGGLFTLLREAVVETRVLYGLRAKRLSRQHWW